MLNIIIFNWIVQQDNMPGHTPFCEIIQCIKLTINKATLKYNTEDLEKNIQNKKEEQEARKRVLW